MLYSVLILFINLSSLTAGADYPWPVNNSNCMQQHAQYVDVIPACPNNATVNVSHNGGTGSISFSAFLNQVGKTSNTTYIIKSSPNPYIVGCKQVTIGSWGASGKKSCIIIKGESGTREDVVLVGADPAIDPDFWKSNQYGGPSSCGIGQFMQIANAEHITIADLTMRNFPAHMLKLDGAGDKSWFPRNILFHNLELHDCGDQLIKGANWATDGIIECSYFHYTVGLFPQSSYETQGIDFHEGRNWIIRDNKFRNIRIEKNAAQSSNGAAVIMWDRTDSVLVERNLVINCDAAFKLGASWYDDQSDRMTAINNLVVYDESDTRWGVSNMFEIGRDVTRGGFYHNTVWNPLQDPGAALVYCPNDVFPFENNVYYTGTTHRAKGARNNIKIVDSTWFESVGEGNFRLKQNHTVPYIPAVPVDIMGMNRANPPTAGAFEFITGNGINDLMARLGTGRTDLMLPNPLQLRTIFDFTAAQNQHAVVTLYDIHGNQIEKPATRQVKPGIYFVRVQLGEKRTIKSVLILEN